MPDYLNILLFSVVAIKKLVSIILRAVIDEDKLDLVVFFQVSHRWIQLVSQILDSLLFIVTRYHQRDSLKFYHGKTKLISFKRFMNYGASYLNALFKALSGMEEKATLVVAIAFFSQHIERKSILTMCKQSLARRHLGQAQEIRRISYFCAEMKYFPHFLRVAFWTDLLFNKIYITLESKLPMHGIK